MGMAILFKLISMNNKGNNGYNNAGLFCELNNATIENLVFDPSCVFNGNSVGALAVIVTGSLTIKNVTNQAEINGQTKVGGLISFVSGLKRGDSLLFENCTNEGNVSANGSDVGGFIGWNNKNINASFEFVNCRNIGTINGNMNVGGFVGTFFLNNASVVNVNKSANDGNVYAKEKGNGKEARCGGLIGYYEQNSHLTISEFINNGNISGLSRVGGVLGAFYTCENAQLVIENSFNYGMVNGDTFTGGFIGYNMGNSEFNMTIVNSVNNGRITSSSRCSGGFAGGISRNAQMNLNIVNSTNNGNINNSNTFGGFVGTLYSNQYSSLMFSGDMNHGLILTNENQGSSFASGFVGYVNENSFVDIHFKECGNTADITGNTRVGGFFW